MTFSIKSAVRGWVAPQHRIYCKSRRWQWIVGELEKRGRQCHEAGVFLLGVERHGRREVTKAIFYDELDPVAYSTGVCILHGEAFAKLWAICREHQLTVVADVHTHPGAALQSWSDKTNPMVAHAGHIAIIVPNFAVGVTRVEQLGIYEYCGNHTWINHTHPKTRNFFYTGFWS